MEGALLPSSLWAPNHPSNLLYPIPPDVRHTHSLTEPGLEETLNHNDKKGALEAQSHTVKKQIQYPGLKLPSLYNDQITAI